MGVVQLGVVQLGVVQTGVDPGNCCFCEITAQGCDDAGAAPGGRSHRAAVLGDENHSGLCCRDICRCFHQGRWENFFYQEGG